MADIAQSGGEQLEHLGDDISNYIAPGISDIFGDKVGEDVGYFGDGLALIGKVISGQGTPEEDAEVVATGLEAISAAALLSVPGGFIADGVADSIFNAGVDGELGNLSISEANGLSTLARTAMQIAANIGLNTLADATGLLNDFENGLDNIGTWLGNFFNGLLGLPSDFIKGLEWLFGARHDPLVIDLTGGGINIEDSSNPLAPYFRFSSGNFATKTSWIGNGNAFLVIQSTNSAYGVSLGDGYRLLGTGAESGFDILKALDGNEDGQINASDPAYASLAVWEDGTGDGVFNPTNVVSLADAGITSISLNTSSANTAIGGSTITQTSTVTFANGTSTEIAQVDLGYNPDETTYTGSYTKTTQIGGLPNIRGYGNVANLDISMSLDPTLTNLVQNLVSDTPNSVAGFDSSIQTIMYEWAGVEAVSTSSGNVFDGQKVDFLAEYTPYTSAFTTNGTPPWFIGQAIAMNGAWNSVFDVIEAQFLVQLPNTALATNFTYLPLAGDIIVPDTYDLGATIEQIATDAPSVSTDGLTYWLHALLVINESASDILRLQSAFGTTNTAYQIGSDALPALSSEPYFSDDVMQAALSGNLTYVDMSALNNVVYGTAGTDLFDVTQSNMTIEGFGGGDEIIVNPGMANLNINEVENNPSNSNELFFAPGISESNVVVTADAAGDIILTYDAQGDQVTLDSMLYGPTSGSEQGPLHTSLPYTPTTEYGVQDVVFADGTTWTASQVIDMLQDNGSPTNATIYAGTEAATLDPAGYANLIVSQGGADTILFNAGYGDLTIDQTDATGLQQSVLQFGSGISAGEILASGDASGDIILTLGTTGTQITLDGMANSGQNGIGAAVFADGTTLTAEQLLTAAGVGSPANTVLYANADTSLLDPNGYAHAVVGAASEDTIVYDEGYGDLTISQSDGSPVLAFGSGVSEANVVVSQDGQGDIILTDLATGATIDLAGMASNGSEISAATFSDGTTWSAAQILEMGDTGNIYNQALYAEAGYNVFDPNGYAHYVQNNSSGSTILYNLGDGNLTVSSSAYAGILQFGTGVSASDISVTVTATTASDATMILTIGSTGSQITLEDQLSGSGISEFTFADGTAWSIQQIQQMADIGSPTNTVIQGNFYFSSIIDPAGFAHVVSLWGPSSTILYNIGYGGLTIYEGAATTPTTLALGAGITESDISVTNLHVNNTPYYWFGFIALNITTGTQVSTITIDNFSPQNGYDGFGQIDLADGTTLSASSILAMADIGSALNTTLWADSSDNLFDPQGYAHTIYTEGDLSTVLYNPGYGALQVYGDQNTTIEFGASITESEVSVVPRGNGDFILNVGTGSDQITLQNGGDIGAVVFADGTTWTEATLLQIADTGSYQGETLTPAAPLNQFYENGIWWLQSANIFNSNGYASEILSTLSGSDTILYNQGYGSLTVDVSTDGYAPYYWNPYYKTYIQNNDVLQFGTGITASEITVEQDASGDLILNVGGTSDVITLVDMLSNAPSSGTTSNPQYGVASAVFADGTTLTAQQLIQLSETGSAENNQTLSSPFTGTTFYTNGYVHQVNGAGDDTIVYNANGGDLVVNEIYQGSILQLGTGISETDVQVAADSNGDVILQIGDAANLITLTGMNYALAGIYQDPQAYDVASVVFADGTTWTSSSIASMLENGTTISNGMYFYDGGETIDPRGVVSNIQDYNNDQAPATFLYNAGYGMLTIDASTDYGQQSSQDILQLGAGIDPSAATISSDASGDIVLTDGVPGDTIVIQGMLSATYAGVGDVTFADGTTWSSQQILAMADIGSPQGTSLYAGYEPNIFDPNGFAHFILDDDNSTILYNEGYGNLQIQPEVGYSGGGGSGASGSSATTGDQSTLVFGAGISFSDLSFYVNDQGAVIVTVGTEHAQITLDSALEVGTPSFVFADGTTLTSDEIIADAEANVSGGTLVGGTGTDTLVPGGLYDVILGQGGADTILYDRTDGSLTIEEYSYNGSPEQSVVQFGSGISASDLTISSGEYGNNIDVSIDGSSDQITLAAMLVDPYAGVSEFVFADGSTLSAAQIIAETQIGSAQNTSLYANFGVNTLIPNGYADLVQDYGGGTDTVLYGTLDGDLTIDLRSYGTPESSVLQFESGITASELSFSADGNGDIIVSIGTTGDQIVLDGMYGNASAGVSEFAFADGSTLTASQIDALAQIASPVNTSLWGDGGIDTLIPDAYTTFVGDYSGGTDTIDYALGDGSLEIGEQVYGTSAQSVLAFGAGISEGDISVSRNENDAIVLTINSTGSTITIDNMAQPEVTSPGSYLWNYGVNSVTFADGTTLSARQLVDMTNIGGPGDTVLVAGGVGSNIFDPNGYAHQIIGSGVADTILYNLGDGNLAIDERANGIYGYSGYPSSPETTLVLGAGISESEIFASEDSSGDIFMEVGTTGSTITLTGELPNPEYPWEHNETDYGIGSVVFGDGTTWSSQQIVNAAATGSQYNTTLIADAGNTVNPNGYAHLVEGYGGASTIIYNQGYGDLTINNTTPGTFANDVLSFGAGISESDVSVTKDGYNIYLDVSGPDNGTITLGAMDYNYHFEYPYARYGIGDAGVGAVVFADGTTWTQQQIYAESDIGSANNTNLTANPGDNVFDPNGFAHSVTDTAGAADTILYSAGYGDLQVNEQNPSGAEQTVLQFDSSVSEADVSVSEDSNGDVILSLTSTGAQITLEGMANSPDDGVGSVTFSDGTTWTAAQILSAEQTGTAGGGALYGGYGQGTLNPAGFVHTIDGGSGDNTILYNAGDGDLTISEAAGLTQQSVLQFGSGISATDITAVGDAAGDLILTVASLGTQITLSGMLADSLAGVASLVFADGSSLTASQLVTMAETGSPTNSVLYGNAYGVELEPNGPVHLIDIGLQADSINYEAGDGNLTINGTYATGNGQAGDTLTFGTGISASDLSASSSNGSDLILTIGTSGSKITLSNMLASGQAINSGETLNYGVSEIIFADGTTLSPDQVIALLNTGSHLNTTLSAGSGDNTLDPAGYAHVIDGDGGTDTILYNRGYGNLLINEQNASGPEQSILELGASIAVADIAISGDAQGDILLTDTVTGAQITLASMLESGDSGVAYGVGSVEFDSTGTVLSAAQLIAAAETGSVLNTTLYAGAGDTTFQSGGFAQVINGKGGADTILYTPAEGGLQINEYDPNGPEQSVLQFGSGVSASDLSIFTDGYGDVVVQLGTTGDEIGLTDMLSGTQYGVGSFVFADGTTLSAAQIEAGLGTIAAASTTLYSTLSSETLDTKGYFSAIQGNGGADTVIYNAGYGNLSITEQSYPDPEQSVLQFGTGISEADVAVSEDSNGDIILGIGSPAAQITLVGMLESNLNGVAAVEFSDGTTWTAAQIIAMTETGSPDHTTLVGGPGNNMFNPNGYAHVIDGNGGADTILFNLGDGRVTVNEENQTGPELSVLQFGTGIAAANISASQDAYGDIILTIGTAGDAVVLSNMIDSGLDGISFGVGSATFVDGTTLSAQQITNLAETGSATNTVLRAGPDGDAIDPNGYARLVLGGAGTNTVRYNQGYGALTIDEQASGAQASVLQFGSGISAAELSATTDAAGDIILTVGNQADQITLTSMANNLSFGIGEAVFADGTTLSAAQLDMLAAETSLVSTFNGLATSISTTDEAAIMPFASLSIADLNTGTPVETITVSLSNNANGSLYDPNAQTDGAINANGILTITGSASEVSIILDALVFTPTAHQVAPSDTVATTLTVNDVNSTGLESSVAVAITATAVEDAPIISGAATGQIATDKTSLDPFANVTISDPDVGANDTVTITVTGASGLPTDANGTLSGTGLTEISAGVYTLVPGAPPSLTAELDELIFAPAGHQVAPGSTVTTGFTITVAQNELVTTNTASSIIATAANDPAVIAGTQAGQTTSDEAKLDPFSGVNVSDPDLGVTETATITLTGSTGVATDADGTLAGVGLRKIGVGTYSLAAATPAGLTAELEALDFSPTAHQVSPGQTVATGFTLAVTQDGITTTDTVTSVIATAANDAPVISGAVAGQTTTDEASAKPFSGVTITDPDLGAADSVVITLTGTSGLATDADGTLTGAGLTKIGTGLYTLSAATPASLTAELEGLTFSPTAHQVAPGNTVTTGFTLAVTQNGLTSANTVSSIITTAVNDAPVIAGTNAGQLTADEASVNPFSGVSISDPDTGVTETATITLTGTSGLATDADGSLSGTGLTKIGAGLYTLAAATPASLTAELEALTFSPTAHQVVPGSTVATSFTLAVTQNGLTVTDSATSVIATAVNDAPVIVGTRAGQTVTDETTVSPFSSATIIDPDLGVVETATITLTGTNGLASDADGSLSGSGLSKIGAGMYTLAAMTPASLTAELEALTFSPTAHQVAPGGTVATGFTLAVTQNGVTTTDNVSSVIVTAANDAPVISGAQAGQVTTDEASLKPFSGVTISDVDLGATDSMAITLTGTNGLATDSDGILSGTGLTKIGTGLYSLAATSPASLTAELEGLTFSPTAHQVAPGSTVTTGFTLAVTQNGLTTANTVSSVLATAVNDAPVISGAVAGQTTTDEAGVKPFSSITVTDPDLGVADSVQITLTGTSGLVTDADGTLSGSGLTKIGTGLYTLAAATPGSLTAELEGLTFSPTAHQVAPGGTVATGFTLAVTQNGLTTVNTSSSVTATPVNDAPVISGAKSGQSTTDAASVKPFSSVIISDPDLGVTETVMITLTGTSGVATDADGILSGTGLTKIGTGLYTLAAASPGSMTAELEALTFSPTAHQVAAGNTVTTEFNLAVTQNGLTTTNTATSVIATASAATLVSNGTLYALQSGETLNTGGTVHVVNDGSFANTIIYNKGNGQLTIENSNPAGADQSILQLGSGISETALTVLSDAAGDILLKDGVTGDQITLTGMMTSLDNGVSSIAFADGTSWTAAELTELATLGTATAHHGLALGSGPSTISGAGVFVVGAGIAKSNVIFESNNSNGNLTIALLGANGQLTGDSVTINGYWWNYKGQATVLFPDGSTLAVGNPVLDTWVGSATQTTLVGSNFSPNLFDIGPGGDQITLGATYNGGNGQNTLAFGYGDGAVIVTPNNASATIALGANILPSEVAFQSNNGNGNLTVELLNASGQPTGDSLTINGYWYNTSGTNLAVFANGTTLALNHQLTDTWIGTATQTTLVGSNFSPNQFDLAPGGDQVTLGASSNGGNGQNTLEFGYGDGAVTVVPNQASATIALGGNILPSEVIFQSNNNNGNLTVDLLNANGQLTGDSLTINGYWWNSSGTNLAVFANGTTLALNHQLTDTWIGSTSQTVLVGSNFSPNIFDLAPGGDQVTLGANYNGGNGQNVVNFGIGDGAVMINGNNGLATISLASGINLAGTTLSTDSSGDVILALSNGTDKLTVAGGMYSSAFQQLDFANGTTLSHSQILYTAETGTTGNDTITAPSGAEVIDGHGGNDVINGGGGYDTYMYRQGYGNLAINNAASGGTVANGELDFGPGITEQDLWFSRSGNNLDINVLGSKSQIAIDNWYGSNSGAQLKEIKAYDGLEIDSGLNQLVAAMAVFETNNPAFNPQTALQMPSYTNLQAALAAVWHA
jgi:plastocyanin